MCRETQTRFHPCLHTQCSHWTYCAILPPDSRNDDTGRACRLYKLRFQNRKCRAMEYGAAGREHCFECTVVRAQREWIEEADRRVAELEGREGGLVAEKEEKVVWTRKGVWYWVKGWFGR